MKYLKIAMMTLALSLVVVGCSNKASEVKEAAPTTQESTKSDDKMSDKDSGNKMADEKMSDKDSGDKMADDKMSDKDSGDKMTDDKMSDKDSDDKMSDDKKEVKVTNKGREAAAFTLTDLDGNSHTLADYKGKKVYVKFWASWCSICLAGLDELNTLSGEDNDFEVLTIVTPGYRGEQSTEDFKKWFASRSGVENITVLLDEGGDIAKAYAVRGYPTSAYIGSDGILVKTLPGHNTNDQIKTSFDKIY